ncbi:rapid alkalinization factor-like [Olea europaea var. sylvestris]|uniref:Rapid alkalinization factor n=1 Tax=Olea europaea subsp. europaea TaxID=158383 RepID=A0A8S0SGY6_OLEEU|nr:rapid alkalinization factor-like [Olea europaea var. sylvestris]CAA2992358.1 rapid alkalinization factor [Olea europaea subsp. europaea]
MNMMERRSLTSMIFTLCIIESLLISQASASGDVAAADVGWLMPMMRSGCKGTIAECLANADEEEDEFQLDSESNRRILATRRYISYGALQKNRVPCSRRGASYYNCRPGAQANPYTRGCSAITRCRG